MLVYNQDKDYKEMIGGEAAKWKLTRPILIKYSPIAQPAAPGERAEDAVRREVMEEINLVLSECTPWDALSVNEPDEVEPVLLKLREIDIDAIGFISIREAVADLLKQNMKIV